jgi:hypothetical protein
MAKYILEHGDVWFERAGKTVFGNNKTHVCDGTGELAVALIDDVMMKCGSADSVDEWIRTKGACLADLTVYRFPVSEETVAESTPDSRTAHEPGTSWRTSRRSESGIRVWRTARDIPARMRRPSDDDACA